jgi:polysaccharide export outer membrane protein
MAMNRLWWLAIAGAALILAGCSSMGEPPELAQAPSRAPTLVEGDYRIGVDDRVQVSVWRNPELTVLAPVRPDGKIAVPIIGDVQVGGLTPSEVAESIKKRLSEYIREPNVAVIVTELRSHEFLSRVRVTGAVRTPRSINHRQGMTVLDAVLEAGGVTEFASPNRSRLFRKNQTKTEVFDIELDDILRKGRLETNLLLSPGDVITVPERLF